MVLPIVYCWKKFLLFIYVDSRGLFIIFMSVNGILSITNAYFVKNVV